MNDLAGKTALVTGGAKGVGKAIAAKLGSRGALVIINYFHSHDTAKETRKELEESGIHVHLIRASVAKLHQVERMFQEIEERFGCLDILVNNAADGALVPGDEITEEHLDRAVNTNLKGAFWCARHAASLMKKKGSGVIVNVSSLGAQFPIENYMVVGPTKAALESMTRYMAAEYAACGIRVNTASAGLLDTDVIRNFPNYEKMREAWLRATPLGRIGHADDLADVVAFLVSDQSRWITGQTIIADGGVSLSGLPLNYRTEDTRMENTSRSAPHDEKKKAAEVSKKNEDIAIVGMGLVLPGAKTPEEYWNVLVEGTDLIIPTPADRWNSENFTSADPSVEDKNYCRHGLCITNFPPEESDTPLRDRTVAWLRHAVTHAMANVASRPDDRWSFVLGYTADGSQHLEKSLVVDEYMRRIAGILAQRVDKKDRQILEEKIRRRLAQHYECCTDSPSTFLPHKAARDAIAGILPESARVLTVDTACSSSLYAIDIGAKALLAGAQDIVVCGGAMSLGPLNGVLFAKLGGLSRTGELRPLDARADGVLFSDGAAVVVLKTLARARADGDRILGIIDSFGCSSDGKGKAVSAPNSTGQQLALRRAMEKQGYDAGRVNWIVAHATGTPMGDATELQSLRDAVNTDQTVYISSNKAVIGHTGWAAGAASVIEILLGLRHNAIPPQHRFTTTPSNIEIGTTRFTIPTALIPWEPEKGIPRLAGASGFGFGGANAHIVVADNIADGARLQGTPPARDEQIAIVAWAAHVPGLNSTEQISAWLKGSSEGPAATFGESYTVTDLRKFLMPPKTLRTVDRSQLMSIECARQLRSKLGAFWEHARDKTGVFLGHMGKTGHSILYGNRCYLDDARSGLEGDPELKDSAAMRDALEDLGRQIKSEIPPANEDSFPGMMPNVIASRVANYFDLHGPAMTLDTGFSSAIAATEVAARYLRGRDVDMALVGGINGTTIPAVRKMLNDLCSRCHQEPGEGVFMFALMREKDAVRAGLPVLGIIGGVSADMPASASESLVVQCGIPDETRAGFNYMGGEGALAVLKALHGENGRAVITCVAESPHFHASLSLTRMRRSHTDHGANAQPTSHSASSGSRLDVECFRCGGLDVESPAVPLTVKRHVVELRPYPRVRIGPNIPFWHANTLLLTNDTSLLEEMGELPDNLTVLSTTPVHRSATSWTYLHEVTPEAVTAALARFKRNAPHIRIVANLERSAPAREALHTETASLTALHDLVFLVVKHIFGSLQKEGRSLVSLFAESISDGIAHPLVGLFAGLFDDVALELESCPSLALFTDSRNLIAGMRLAEDESGLKRACATVLCESGEHKTWVPLERDIELQRDGDAHVSRESVIVATGGARGITAEVTKELARRYSPKLYLIGSNPIYSYPDNVFEGSDEQFKKRKADFIREQNEIHPEKTVKTALREFYRMYDARLARRNIDEMIESCGSDRVTYLTCDVLNRNGVTRNIEHIIQREGRIDLLINGAGANRSQSIPMKHVDDFRFVRDVKYKAYLNLKNAVRGHSPRLWCNFGSMVCTVGVTGEPDYLAGNAFLNTAARYAAKTLGDDEFTIGWPVWGDAGMVTSPYNESVVHAIRQTALFTEITREEGAFHFMRELNQARHDPVTVLLGTPEKHKTGAFFRKSTTFAPAGSAFDADDDTKTNPEHQFGFYLDRLISEKPGEKVFERRFDLKRDAYLTNHVINGYPTLPGTFVPEIAAEAALQLAPGMAVQAFEDIEFIHFLRVYTTDKPTVARIEAKTLEQTKERAVVGVRILTDVVSPQGVVLKRNRVHFQLKVVLGEVKPEAPMWERWETCEEQPVPDAYHVHGSPILLTDKFISTKDTRLHPLGRRATYKAPVKASDENFSTFLTPVFLLDGLARVAALTADEYLPLAAPRHIERIEIFESTNDAQIGTSIPRVDLYSTGGPFFLTSEQSTAYECAAVRPDGRVIVRINGLKGVVVGYINKSTGEFRRSIETQELTQPARQTPTDDQADELETLARSFEQSVQKQAISSSPRSFDEHITMLNKHLLEARDAGHYYYGQEISNYDGAWVELNGRRMLMLASYSYLDLLGHPRVKAAAKAAIDKFGTGTHGARLLAGTTSLHRELEQTIARFKHTEDAIVYSSGYVTNLATISTLVGKGDWVICDTLNHTSIVDGAAFSQARFVQFSHNNMEALDFRLAHCRGGRKLVVVDGLFSMDGDIINLPEVIRLCRKHDAMLMVDEAHCTGVLGRTGHGICEHFGLDDDAVDLKMGTLSKSIASVGGYVAGKRDMIFALKNYARGFVFTAALPPAQTAAAKTAFDVIRDEPWRVEKLHHNVRIYTAGLRALGFNTLHSNTPIAPIICDSVVSTVKLTRFCRNEGVFVLPVFYPAVPLESPRLRTIVTAAHSDEDIRFALDVLKRARGQA